MATLQKIRNRGSLLMLIIGLALFAFVIGDAIKNSSSYFGKARNMVGEVDGEPIEYNEFRKKVSENIQQAESQRGRISSQERDMLEMQSWNQMVEGVILGKVQDDLGLSVTTEELSHIFLKKTDDVVKRAFGDADEATISKQIANVENSSDANAKGQFKVFTDYVKEKRLRSKYFTMLSKGLERTKALSVAGSTEGKVNFRYVRKDYATIADSMVSVSDKEIADYYAKHKEMFKQMPAREISYVKIAVVPSAEDLAFSTRTMEDIKVKFAQANNPVRFASVNSEKKPDTRFFKKEEIRDTELAEFAFSGTDEVYGPYGRGYVSQLSRVSARKMMPDSVKASHILLRATKDVKTLRDSIVNALEKGADFVALAKKYSQDKGSGEKGGELGWFGKGQMIPAFQDVAFSTAKGKIATVDTQFGTHIIKVLDRGVEHENVQIATITKETTPSNKTYQVALTDARHIAENVKTLEELEAAAKEKNVMVKSETFYAGSMGLREVPNSKELVRTAFATEENNTLLRNKDNSTVFELDECYVVAGLKKIKDTEYASVDDDNTRKFILAELRKDKKAKMISDAMASVLTSGVTLEEIAEKEGVEIQSVAGATFDSNYLPGLGQEPKVVATAILDKNESGVVGKAIQGNSGVYVIADIVKVEDTGSDYDAITSFYNKSLERKVSQQGYQALYDNAEVTDERYRF